MKNKILLLILFIASAIGLQAQNNQLRIMSYNVRNGYGIDKIHSYDRPAKVINKTNPDIVAVQELDSITRRYPDYVLGELATRCNMHAYYGPAISFGGGKYGVGILTRKPALSVQQHSLPCKSEPRTLLIVEMEDYYFACTHLSLHAEDRMTSMSIIQDIVSKLDKPVFIAGDFNAEPNDPEIQKLAEFCTIHSRTDKPTWDAANPTVCIDYIVSYGCDVKCKKACIIKEKKASDHRPIFVDVKF